MYGLYPNNAYRLRFLFSFLVCVRHKTGVFAQQNDVPLFQPPPHENKYRLTINQNKVVGSVIFTARCVSEANDASNQREVIYGINSSNNYFTMDNTSGDVSLDINARDLPGDGPFAATIYCRYANVSNAITSAELSVRYEIRNKHVPRFTQEIFDVWVHEDHFENVGPVVAYLNVTDNDLEPCNIVTFEILTGNVDATFSIGSQNGELRLNRGLDYNAHQKYNLTIKATNRECGNLLFSARTTVCVYVDDVDNEHPIFQQHLYNFSFMEGQSPPPSNFVQLQCFDADTPGAQIEYDECFSDEGTPFEINQQSGNVSATRVLDYEQQPFYHLTFVCYNVLRQNIADTAVVRVNIIPVNEHLPDEFTLSPPILFLDYTTPIGTLLASARNNSQAPVTISVVDRDKGLDHGKVRFTQQDRYNMDNEYSRYFSIDTDSGDLTLVQSFDFDVCSNHVSSTFIVLGIVVCDAPQNSSRYNVCPSHSLSLIVTTNPGVCTLTFQERNYSVSVSESARTGSELLQVQCKIPGMGRSNVSNQYIYDVISMNSQFSQTLVMEGNRVILEESLDYESVHQFMVYLQCRSDDGQESNATLTVNVLPENDNPPYFEKPLYPFRITADQFKFFPATIGYISAMDEDKGIGNNLTYTLRSVQNIDSTCSGSCHFTAVTLNNGSVLINMESYPREDVVGLDIGVSDGAHSANCVIVVVIDDCKDNLQTSFVNMDQCGTICVVLLAVLIIIILAAVVVIMVVCVRFFCLVSKRKLHTRPDVLLTSSMTELHAKPDLMEYATVEKKGCRQSESTLNQL